MQIGVWGRYIDQWSRRNGHWGLDKRNSIRDFDEIREVKAMYDHDVVAARPRRPLIRHPQRSTRGLTMNAANMRSHRIHVGEVPDPVPKQGQALVRTHSCGLCASDVHFLHLGSQVVEISKQFGGPYSNLDLSQVIVPGHEYVGEIIDYGPSSRRPLRTGTRATSIPVMRTANGLSVLGHRSSVIGHRSSVIGHRSSVIGHLTCPAFFGPADL